MALVILVSCRIRMLIQMLVHLYLQQDQDYLVICYLHTLLVRMVHSCSFMTIVLPLYRGMKHLFHKGMLFLVTLHIIGNLMFVLQHVRFLQLSINLVFTLQLGICAYLVHSLYLMFLGYLNH